MPNIFQIRVCIYKESILFNNGEWVHGIFGIHLLNYLYDLLEEKEDRDEFLGSVRPCAKPIDSDVEEIDELRLLG